MRRWSALSNIEKFDAYTRWSIYFLVASLPLVLAIWQSQQIGSTTLRSTFWIAVLAVTAMGVLATHRFLGAKPLQGMPVKGTLSRAMVVVFLVVAAGVVALARVTWGAPNREERGAAWVLGLVMAYAVTIVTIRSSQRVLLAAAAAGIVMTFGLLLTYSPYAVYSSAISVIVMFIAAIGSIRMSVAMLDLMYRIDRAREVEAKLAVAEERLRFARDLHDTLGRNLSAISIKTQVARALVAKAGLSDAASERASAELDAVRDLAGDSLGEMRAVVRGYHETSLATELSGARRLLESAGISCSVEGSLGAESGAGVVGAVASGAVASGAVASGAVAGGAGCDEALAWVVREAVTNVIRHSTATWCRITLLRTETDDVVQIANDGAPSEKRDGAGSGIAGLQARLASHGGQVSVDRPRAGEFMVTGQVPR